MSIKNIAQNFSVALTINQQINRLYYGKLLGSEKQTKRVFKEIFGYDLDLVNPNTFNEKINLLKLYYGTDEMAILAGDKIGLHEYIQLKDVSVTTVPVIAIVSSFNDISWESLPNQFVIKKSNASSLNIIIKDKTTISKKNIKRLMNKWSKYDYGLISGEPHYSKMIGKFIIEEYIPNINNDWKIFYFNGEPKAIEMLMWVDEEVTVGHRKSLYITTDMTGKILNVEPYQGMDKRELIKY